MTLLQSLRAATTTHHENLHGHPALSQLTEDSVNHAYYLQALRKFYGFYAPLERRYQAAAISLQSEFPAGDITRRLQNDLNHAGVDTDHLDTLEGSEEPFTLEQSVAYLYLREGSNLGGKIISKNLHAQLSLEPGITNQFFWGHGADAGRNWQAFLRQLPALESQVDINDTARFAAHLFQKLDGWLSQQERVHVSTAS